MPLESTRDYLESQQGSGVGSDIERLKTGTAATTEELREFLRSIKGRSPEEVMGVVAQSSLLGSTLLALAGTVLVFLILTAIPYALEKNAADKDVVKQSPRSEQTADETTAKESTGNATPQEGSRANSPGPELNREEAAKALGVDGVADPKAAPEDLDNKLEKLLDGL